MFRKVLTVLTLILVVFVVWGAREDIFEAINYLSQTNLFFILLLIPEQLFMYYCAGQIFFSYMAAKANAEAEKRPRSQSKSAKSAAPAKSATPAQTAAPEASESASDTTGIDPVTKTSVTPRRVSSWLLARISFELNFVNHAIPSGGFAGLGYITWRLKAFGSSVGQTSFMYVLRYSITILANQFQTLVAIAVLLILHAVPDKGWWVIGLTALISLGVVVGLAIIVIVASSRKRITWFAKLATSTINTVVNALTFGHKRKLLTYSTVETYFIDIYKDLTVAKANKRILIHPIMWGIIYSFFEVATYWLVGISMGHPEILPQIMVAEALGSVVGAVMLTPGGVGGYEGVMIFIMSTLGVDVGLATAVVITTRVVVLVGTIVSGYGFYQNAISKIGKKEREQIMKEVGE